MNGTFDRERESLLLAVAESVVFDGWTRAAIATAARDLGLDPVDAERLFPGGASEVLEAFSDWADQRMVEFYEAAGTEELRYSEKVALAVRLRLEAVEPYREAVRKGATVLALPRNGALGLRLLYRTVDAVWHTVGDTSTDYNFYSKRLLLACVYSSTLLYWLNDSSEGFERTWAFLDRRIAEVLKIGGRAGQLIGKALSLPERLVARRVGRTRTF